MTIAARTTPCPRCGMDPTAYLLRGSPEAVGLLRKLSESIADIARYGFDKDVTKDEEACRLWLELNDAQKAAREYLGIKPRTDEEGK